MPTKLTILICCIFYFASCVSAQEENKFKYFSVGVNPSMELEPITPSIGIMVEHSIWNNFNLEYTYGLDVNSTIGLDYHPNSAGRHHEFKVLLKYFLTSKTNTDFAPYLGIDYFAIRNLYELTNDTYEEENVVYDFEKADISRKVDGVRLNFGFKSEIGNNFWLDVYTGIGSRVVNLEYIGVSERTLSGNINFGDSFIFGPKHKTAGIRKGLIAIALGVNISYRFF